MIERGPRCQLDVHRAQGRIGLAVDAFGVRAIERQAGEELGRHAPSLARVVAAATGARAGGLWLAQLAEHVTVLPDLGEPTDVAHRTGLELIVDHERAGVDVADRVDQADDPSGPAHVEAGQGIAERVEVEERIAGQHGLALRQQPLVDLPLLRVGRMQVVPRVGTAPAGAQAGDAQLRAIRIRKGLEVVELIDVVAGDDHADLERAEVGDGKVVHRSACGVVRAGAAQRIVGRCIDSVNADLDVEVFHRGQAAGVGGIDVGAVGGELHADAVADGVLDELEEVAAHHRLTPADVDVEDLQIA